MKASDLRLSEPEWWAVREALFASRREADKALDRIARGSGRTAATTNAQMRWIKQRDKANALLEKVCEVREP